MISHAVMQPGTAAPSAPGRGLLLQRKLALSASNDPLEQEADRIAEQVLAASDISAFSAAPPRIQRFTGQASAQADTVPGSVERVLARPGRPLETALRSDMEKRFGHDFSRVRVHSGSAAEQSAREVNANAYTVGHNIVFGAGRFTPGTSEGRRLLAHELTHVVQQSGVAGIRVGQTDRQGELSSISKASNAQSIQRKVWIGTQILTVDEPYKKIVKDTWGEKALRRLVELHSDSLEHKLSNWGELIAEYERARTTPDPVPEKKAEDVCASLPGFGQRGGSCGAASLITPVLIWDNEQYSSGDPNPRLKSVVQKMKTYMQAHKKTLEQRFSSTGKKDLFQSSLDLLADISNRASSPSFKLTSTEYESMGSMLMWMSQDKFANASGLSDAEMQTARQTLGFPTKTTSVLFFDDFFKPGGELAKLKPGQMAQIIWFVEDQKKPADPLQPARLPIHAFTIGRLSDAHGTWVLNDQGYKQPLCLQGIDLPTLRDAMLDASEEGKWWGVTDDKYHEPETGVQPGYTILGNEKTLSP